MLKKLLGLGLCSLLLFALGACGDDDDNGGAPGSSDTLVVGLSSEPENLSPLFMDFYSGNWKVFNGLVAYDADLNLVPDLAAEMPTFSDDGLRVAVQLRSDVTFHDGESFTSEDVVFTWNAMLDSGLATELRDRFDIANVLERVEAVDEHNVEFFLKRQDAAFIHKLFVGIVPAHVLDGQDLNTSNFNRAPVGTGPYVFDEWRSGERIVLVANEEYYGGAPGIPRLVFTFVADENARAAQLTSGAVDAVALPPRLASTFRDNSDFRVLEVPSGDARIAVLPHSDPNLQDPRVRRALAMAINRQAIIEGVLDGAGEPAYGPFIVGAPAPEIPYDVDAATALLEAAGWTKGSDGFFARDGQRLGFELMYPATDSVRRDIALAIRSDLQQLGIDVNAEGAGWDVITPRFDTGEAGNVFGWGQPYDPELELYSLFHSDFADDGATFTNPARLVNATIDDALDRGRTSLDPDDRRQAYQEFQQALQEDGSWLFTVYLRPTVVLRSNIENVEVQREGHAHGFSRGLMWAIERWTIR